MYITYEEILRKYPRTIKVMKYAAILCTAEAVYALKDYKRGDDYSGEAVNHFGGIRAVIRCGYNSRHSIKKFSA
jgi:hypothetical protein